MLSPRMRKMYVIAVFLGLASAQARPDQRYAPGVTDTQIMIGQTMPYSGPLSAYASFGRAQAAYFAKINAEGGVNGRRIKLVSLDDGFNPARTVEQTRKLVEDEQVSLLFSSFGTATNAAVQKYLNGKKVPQLFIVSGASYWAEPAAHPWTMAWPPTYQLEARTYAQYLLRVKPNAKIAVLYQNDDYGKDYLSGFKAGLGQKAGNMIVAEASYAPSDPTVDSQVVTLMGSGADTLVDFATAKAAAQAIRKANDIGWKPLHIMTLTSSSVETVLKPAGIDKAVGLLSSSFIKDPGDPQWKDDPAMQEWRAWMKEYYPDGKSGDMVNVVAYSLAQTLVQVLKQCGDDLTRENVMRQATNLRNLELPMLLPGIKIDTSPNDYELIQELQLMRFDGARWVRFGAVVGNGAELRDSRAGLAR